MAAITSRPMPSTDDWVFVPDNTHIFGAGGSKASTVEVCPASTHPFTSRLRPDSPCAIPYLRLAVGEPRHEIAPSCAGRPRRSARRGRASSTFLASRHGRSTGLPTFAPLRWRSAAMIVVLHPDRKYTDCPTLPIPSLYLFLPSFHSIFRSFEHSSTPTYTQAPGLFHTLFPRPLVVSLSFQRYEHSTLLLLSHFISARNLASVTRISPRSSSSLFDHERSSPSSVRVKRSSKTAVRSSLEKPLLPVAVGGTSTIRKGIQRATRRQGWEKKIEMCAGERREATSWVQRRVYKKRRPQFFDDPTRTQVSRVSEAAGGLLTG